jgi:hypothetical protein
VSGHDAAVLCTALRAGDPGEATSRAMSLIGRGAGLTPEGDDLLAGVVAGYRHVALSFGDTSAADLLEAIRDPLLTAARSATTRLSCALLRHAFAGEVAAPVGALLRALTGRGDLDAALAATMAIGGSSGAAMARGVVGGAAAACGTAP